MPRLNLPETWFARGDADPGYYRYVETAPITVRLEERMLLHRAPVRPMRIIVACARCVDRFREPARAARLFCSCVERCLRDRTALQERFKLHSPHTSVNLRVCRTCVAASSCPDFLVPPALVPRLPVPGVPRPRFPLLLALVANLSVKWDSVRAEAGESIAPESESREVPVDIRMRFSELDCRKASVSLPQRINHSKTIPLCNEIRSSTCAPNAQINNRHWWTYFYLFLNALDAENQRRARRASPTGSTSRFREQDHAASSSLPPIRTTTKILSCDHRRGAFRVVVAAAGGCSATRSRHERRSRR